MSQRHAASQEAVDLRQQMTAAGTYIRPHFLTVGCADIDGQQSLIVESPSTGFCYAYGEHIPAQRRRLSADERLRVDQEIHGSRPQPAGGARVGAGRKPADGKSGSRRQVVLDDETIAICRQAGGGELSAGIRAVAASYRLFLER